MKKVYNFVFTFFIATTILVSCSSDDEVKENPPSIIGIWTVTESTLNGNNVTSQNVVKFSDDNQVEFIYENYGNDGEDITETGTWEKNGNTVRITWNESDPGLESYVLEIIEFTHSSLVWETNIPGEGLLKETLKK